MRLDGRVFLITGATGAIAGSILERFHVAGATLVLVNHRYAPRLQERAEAVGGHAIVGDLFTPAGAEDTIARALAAAGRIDGLVHTVGGFAMGPLHEAPPEDYDRMFDLNVRTSFYVIRALLPHLLERGDGFIAAISAAPAWTGAGPGVALYGASKAALATMLRSLDGELAGTDIQIAIPHVLGPVDTPGNRAAMSGADPTLWIDPREIGDALVFAASRSARGRVLELPIALPRPRR